MNFQKYIDKSLRNCPSTEALLQFKKHMANKMEKRAEEIRAAGLNDEKVLYDLILSLYPNLEERFRSFVPVVRSNVSIWDMTNKRMGWYAI